MRVLKLYTHGTTMGTPPGTNAHQRSKRGEVSGWSHAATRRNVAFLRSVKEQSLTGHGLSITLTLRDCPDTPEDWHSLRNAFIRRMKRIGLIRFHWVTEWQRRGVPHLHGAFWFENPVQKTEIIKHWLQVSSKYGSSSNSQHTAPIDDPIGWFKYLSKHAARGVSHYQRSSNNLPSQWQSKTGRVWGRGGDWETVPECKFHLDDQAYYQFRRFVRRWRVAEAREFDSLGPYLFKNPIMQNAPVWMLKRLSGGSRRVSQARRMLKCNNRQLSNVRGVSEWISEDLVLAYLQRLADSGSEVRC